MNGPAVDRSPQVAPALADRLAWLAQVRVGVLCAEREADRGLFALAETMNPAAVAFLVRHGTGYLRVPMLNADADRLNLPLMRGVAGPADTLRYTVAVDARHGVSTGISAADRARTIGLLAARGTEENDLCRPGHVVPVRVNAWATESYGYPEATVDAARLCRARPAAVFTELVGEGDGTGLLNRDGIERFALRHELPAFTMAELRAAAELVGLRPPG